MRSLGGFVLLAGIGVALFVYLPAPVDSGTSLDQLQRIAASRAAQLPPAKFTPVSRLTSFSPSIALRMPARRGPRFASLESTAAPAPAQAPIASDAQTGWQTTVVSAATAPPTEFAPRDPNARYKLVLDIQQQLRRAGCYWDRMDGSWGFATKDAMKEFTDRLNATLPLDEPDDVQLALIQSHSDKVCGACPAGQSPIGIGTLRRLANHGAGAHEAQRCPAGHRGAGARPEGGAPLENQRGAWRPCGTAAVQADADDGGLDRPAAGTHGDWGPDPDDG